MPNYFIIMEYSKKLAHQLLQIKAIKINTQNFFVWASGILSPVYCDNRIALSYPEVRNTIKKGLLQLSERYKPFDFIAGVATAGIPFGMILAEELNMPFAYIRSAPKSHGRKNLIEGDLPPDKTVLVVEDLISTGGSSIKAVKAVRANGNTVRGVISIFSYNLNIAKMNFDSLDCPYDSITDYDVLIKEAENQNYISGEQYNLIKNWRSNPENWFKTK